MSVTDTVLIVPAFNEGSVITSTLSEARRVFDYVVCVDDGSSDDTYENAQASGAIILRHVVNLGQGAALQTGIEYAQRLPVSYFVSFDADGQHSCDDVLAMRQSMIDDPVDVVLGSRFLGTSQSIPKARRILLRAAVLFSNLTSGLKLTDAHNGLRLFNRHVAQTICLQDIGYRHASEFTEKIAKNQYTYRELPVTIRYSDYSLAKGQSALNAVNIVADTLTAKVLQR
ncbi:MAG: glycosyltransferase family 2 protein [Propionibacteriaceae bacterium]|jgi:glycosyltransferase involved in cell wall biosynthesis|nr:glycosyltransferase family 2 protein [Propionibacteriaceae bacterium]